jgi:hypothetical protein
MRLLSRRPVLLLVIALLALVAIVAIPALAASPSPSAGTTESPRSAESTKPGKGPKQEKVPEVAVTLSGTVGTRAGEGGETEYTLTVGSTIYTLHAGPAWYWKDEHPLKPFAGKSVTVAGEQKKGSTEVDVQMVDGKVVRAPGKPPWAGGWKVVGKDHPGWSQDKADRWAAKVADKKARFGLDCWPPGQCKDASGKPATPNATAPPAP